MTVRRWPSRSWPARLARVLGAGLLGLAATVSVVVAGSGEAAAQGCGPAPAGRVAVAVVVDDGSGISQRCVVVDERTDGYAVLRAAGHQLRIEAGFLCGIDGYPATGCGNRPGFDGSYWRYFHATPGGAWTYSSVGGGGYRMPARCAIEGWRWTTTGSTDTPPRTPPPAVTCEAPPVTAPPTVPAAPPAAAAPPAVAPPAAAPGPGAAAPPSATPSGGGAVDPAPGPSADPGAPSGTQADGDPAAAPDDGASTEVEGAEASAEDDDAADTDGAEEGAASVDGRVATARAADARRAEGGDGGSPVGVVVAVLVVAGLGGGALWRSRRSKVVAAGESVEGP